MLRKIPLDVERLQSNPWIRHEEDGADQSKGWGSSFLPCINPGMSLLVSILTVLRSRRWTWNVSGAEEQFMGIRKSWGKNTPEFQMPREMDIRKWIWYILLLSPSFGLSLGATNPPFTPAGPGEVLLDLTGIYCAVFQRLTSSKEIFIRSHRWPVMTQSITGWQEKPTYTQGFGRQSAPSWLQPIHLCSSARVTVGTLDNSVFPLPAGPRFLRNSKYRDT